MGVPTTRAPHGLGPPILTKTLVHLVEFLKPTAIRGEPPTQLIQNNFQTFPSLDRHRHLQIALSQIFVKQNRWHSRL